MNNVKILFWSIFICNFVNAEEVCNPESIKTSEIEKCIRITNSKIEMEIKKGIDKKISLLHDSKTCQDRFNEVSPGKEAQIEKLLCIQEGLKEIKNKLDTNIENNTRHGIILSEKTFLYTLPNYNQITKLYLVKNDKVDVIEEKIDENKEKWYFINYKGKKEINMWIKADSVDLN
ncbi:hypothetical protein HYE55_11475 [Aggregatibacter actinomycetemcomitans]|nr:hypothetical protein [Aggregatibacter actinomycetemcomitans]